MADYADERTFLLADAEPEPDQDACGEVRSKRVAQKY